MAETQEDVKIANIGGTYYRFLDEESLASIDGVKPIDTNEVENMSVDQIDDLYSQIVGARKKFKTRELALASLNHQISKLPQFDPHKPKAAVDTSATKTGRAKKESVFELGTPPDPAKALQGLAPQAKELVAIMVELATEKNAVEFSSKELEAFLSKPGMAERLVTKQLPIRIFNYYKKKLITAGLLKETEQ